MKTLLKSTILFSVLLSVNFYSIAQDAKVKNSQAIVLSAGADGGFSAGSFKNYNKWNIGGSLQADIPVAAKFYFTANAGYLNFVGKKNILGTGVTAPDIHYLPVMAGLKYFVFDHIYVQADAGTGFVLNKSSIGYDKTAAFIYTPRVGAQIPVGGSSFIDAGVLYEATTKYVIVVNDSKINFFGIRIAYAFAL